MPERNFEQQARDMANGFSMEPKPEVWQNVRNRIREPQRKRRIALWWWLLPVALAGGAIAFFTVNPKSEAIKATTVVDAQQKKETTVPTSPDQQALQPETKGDAKKGDHTSTVLLAERNAARKKQPTSTQTFNRTVVIKKKEKTVDDDFKESNTVSKSAIDAYNIPEQSNAPSSSITDSKKQAAKDSMLIVENGAANKPTDSLNGTETGKDSLTAALTAPTEAAKSSALNKQKKLAKLKWGIMAEGGVAARKSSLLSLAGFDKSLATPSFIPNANDPGAGMGQPGRSNIYYENNIQHGAAFGLGIAVQKKINNQFGFFADVAYHYQSFGIVTTAYRDSLMLNSAFSTLAGSYKTAQAFHFTSLFAGINWHFINTKKAGIGISAGVDNLFLLKASQQINGINNRSANFSLESVARRSDSTFTTGNFNRYQPGIFAGALVNIQLDNRQLQLMPFVRSSFRQFDRSTSSSNNHLFSGGLRAVYFFK